MYHSTSETVDFKFVPDWKSFRLYSIRLLVQKLITIKNFFGDKVSLYNILKKKFIQDLLAKLEE